ncbi:MULTISPECIES: LPS O-antigen chain length determinant protein WzzB [unclassified Vibrio]|uniref:LPS O-antigen chain length determinant protein WzzB n=1 Tax=unclassified Vibrio TaxID=2614977 RepID=UPI001268B9CC|nr:MULTISPECIES: Wzz/FepE/Etk N-terminal domain-containing protein [unclassified Vibrio]QFT34998.1 Ferric enterobactin transport protein FepE [Vibrio sp. THAF64]QGM32897.1 Ferric enterobactin transport protein FepE [Vibrio sp. THAF191d]QGN68399.1 Ferric enterobactin transport protein FepE [Vibrio sp. THAF191c]
MSGQIQQSPNEQQYSPQLPNSFPVSDEIDLRELLEALWNGKLIIIITTLVFAVGAVVFALNSQEWWSSKAKVTKAQPQDIAAYQQQVKQFQPVFDIYQDDGTVLVSEELDNLVDTEVLFKRFVDAFNSSNNKRDFLDSSSEFRAFKAKLETETETETETEAEVTRQLYAAWFQKITVKQDGIGKQSPYDISLQSTTKESSYSLLNEYIGIIKRKAHQNALNNLQAVVDGKRNELIQQKRILESQAVNKLVVEIERAKFAMDIAKAAGVTQPIRTNSSNEIFGIDLGTKALEAKVKALELVKNLSVVEPRLQQINAKLDMLEYLKIDRSIRFQTFRFLESVDKPISRDKPKRTLIVILGTLLGGTLGVAIVLIRFAFRREQD